MTVGSTASLVGRLDARASVREGEEMEMFVDMSRAHVFEPGELGVNVTAMAEQTGASARAN
jgi:hypothetical protein